MMVFVFTSNCYASWIPAFLEMACQLEVVNEFLVLFVLFCLRAQLLLCLLNCLSTHAISHLHPSNSLPHPTGGSERVAIWGSAANRV